MTRRWSPLFESEQPREIKLQPLNAKLLRELIGGARRRSFLKKLKAHSVAKSATYLASIGI